MPRGINVEIVKRSDMTGFVVLPKRWIMERMIAWLDRCRRLAKDGECLNRKAHSIRLKLRKLGWSAIRFRIDSYGLARVTISVRWYETGSTF